MFNRVSQAKELAPDSVVLLAGNKIDLADERTVSQEDAQDFADSEGVPYYEISSKENTNVTDMFEAIVDIAYQAVNPEPKATEQSEPAEPKEPDSEPEPDETDELKPASGKDSSTVRPRDEDDEQEKSSGCSC